MPIPIRSQSVKRTGENANPPLQPASRQQTRNNTEDPKVPAVATTKPTSVKPASPKNQSHSFSLRDLRSSSRPANTSHKPPNAHTRSVSIASVPDPHKRIPGNKARVAAPTTTDFKRPGVVTKPRPASQIVLPTRTHTRSVSTSAANKQALPSSKQATPKSELSANASNSTSRQRPEESRIGDTINYDSATLQSSLLRDELYQLQLVYAKSSGTLWSHSESVHKIINHEITKIRNEQYKVLELERNVGETEHLLALQQWSRQAQHFTEKEKVQQLSMALAQISRFMSSGESLDPLHRFESWLRETLLLRDNRTIAAEAELLFSDTLGPAWRAETSRLEEQLWSLRETLTQFGPADGGSGIGWALQTSLQYVTTMIQETQTALSLESALSKAESVWETAELDNVQANLTEGSAAVPARRTGIWT